MGKLGEIQIADSTSEFTSGGAFPLEPEIQSGMSISQEPETSEIIPVNKDWEVEIQSDNPFIVARGSEELTPEGVFSQAYEYAQQGLDMLSVQHHESFNTQNAWNQHLIWWPESQLQKLRIFHATRVPLSGGVTATTGEDESKREDEEQEPAEWHESFRYYRLSQTTDDLFTAYRNMFLALEMILSSEVKPYEGREYQWLEDALNEAEKHSQLNLVHYTLSDEIDDSVGETICDEQWTGIRNAMFHAKDEKPVLRPQRPEDRKKVREAMNQLTRLYVSLVNAYLDVRISSGGVTHTGFELMTQWMKEENRLVVSDDGSKLSKDERIASPEWVDSQRFPTKYSSDLSGAGLQAVISRIESEKMDLACVRRLGLVRESDGEDEGLAAMVLFEPGITFENIDEIDAVFGFQMENENRPRSLYPL